MSVKILEMKAIKILMEKAKEGQLLGLYRTDTVFDLSARYLSKYTTKSYQAAYMRVAPMVNVINRLGYVHRNMMNPFNPLIYTQDDPRMTVEEVIFRLLAIAASTTEVPAENEAMHKFLMKLNAGNISLMKNRSFTLIPERQSRLFQLQEIAKTPFKRIERESGMPSSPYVKEAIGLLIEEVGWGTPRRETILYQRRQTLFYDNDFLDYYDTVKSALMAGRDHNAPSSVALERNIPILTRLLDQRIKPLYIQSNYNGKSYNNSFIEDFVRNRWVIGKKYTLQNYTQAQFRVQRPPIAAKNDIVATALGRALIQKRLFGVTNKVEKVSFDNWEIKCELSNYISLYLEKVRYTSKNEVSSVISLLSMNNQMKDIMFSAVRLEDDAEKLNQTFKDTVYLFNSGRGSGSLFPANYLYKGQVRPIAGNVTAIIGIGFSGSFVILYMLATKKRIADRALIVSSGSKVQAVRLYTAIGLLLGKEFNASKIRFDELVAVAENERQQFGDYTIRQEGNSTSIQGGRGNRLFYALPLAFATQMVQVIDSTVFIEDKRGFISLGNMMIKDHTGESKLVPYLVTPWSIPKNPGRVVVRFGSVEPLGEAVHTSAKLTKMSEMVTKFNNIFYDQFGDNDVLEKLLKEVILQSCNTDLNSFQKLLPIEAIIEIELFLRIETPISTRDVSRIVKSTQGDKIMTDKVTETDTSVYARADRVIKKLTSVYRSQVIASSAADIVAQYEVTMTLWLLVVFLRLNLPHPMLNSSDIAELVKPRKYFKSTSTLAKKLVDERSFKARLQMILNTQGITNFKYEMKNLGSWADEQRVYEDDSWVEWATAISTNCLQSGEDGSWLDWQELILNWQPGSDLPTPIDTVRALRENKNFNASDEFVDAFLMEFFMTKGTYALAKNLNAASQFCFWSGSYINKLIFVLWGTADMQDKFGHVVRIY